MDMMETQFWASVLEAKTLPFVSFVPVACTRQETRVHTHTHPHTHSHSMPVISLFCRLFLTPAADNVLSYAHSHTYRTCPQDDVE